MLGTKSRVLIVLGPSQLPAELAVGRPWAGGARVSLALETAYLPFGSGPTTRQLFTPQLGGHHAGTHPGTTPVDFYG